MVLSVGPHRLRGTDGIVHIHGKRQIVLEWGAAARDLLLTMDLYGNGGRHIARLRRNEWTFNDHDRFTFARGVRGLTLTDTSASQVVLHARVVGEDEVVITGGMFRSSTGQDVEILRDAGADQVSAS